MDHAAWLAAGAEGEDETRERYMYFMRPEPLDRELGPIITMHDELTGREMRSRTAFVGMTRNAEPEAKKEFRVYLDPMPHIRVEHAKPLQGWYQAKLDPEHRPRPCFTDAILTEPYGGYCSVGCSFCYVNSGMRGYRGSGLVSVPIDYGAQVRKQLATLKTSAAGYFSSFTDPFLPLESYYHNSESGASAFVEAGLPIFFLSRLSYPGWAIDLLKRNRYSYAQKSINTPSPADWKALSPGAISLDEHFAEIRELRRQGIYVSIQVNPVMAGIVSHEDVEHLFELLADAGANHVIVKFVEAGYSWAPTMVSRTLKRFGPERTEKFQALFTQNIGGQRTIAEEYRMEGHHRYRRRATVLGMTYATCYEYRYARDEAGEILSKQGVSVGKEFLTGDQCHGHRVPMFSRERLSDPFREVEECPPTGCLVCSDDNAGKPRCGSELFGQAKALRLPDLRTSVHRTIDEADE